jgi:hypothetical protein
VVKAALDVDPAEIYPVAVGDDPSVKPLFASLAEGTGGRAFDAATPDDAAPAILDALSVIAGGNRPPDCSSVILDTGLLRPPNHTMVKVNALERPTLMGTQSRSTSTKWCGTNQRAA